MQSLRALHAMLTLPVNAEVVEEAVRVFGSAEQLPQREAVDGMDFTVSCLKVAA